MNDDLNHLFKELDDVNNDEDDKEKDIDQLMRELNLDVEPETSTLDKLGIQMDQYGYIMDSPIARVNKLDIPGKNLHESTAFKPTHSELEQTKPSAANLALASPLSSSNSIEKKTEGVHPEQLGERTEKITQGESAEEHKKWLDQARRQTKSSKELGLDSGSQQTGEPENVEANQRPQGSDQIDLLNHHLSGIEVEQPAARTASKTMSATLTKDLHSLLGDAQAFGIQLDDAPVESHDSHVVKNSKVGMEGPTSTKSTQKLPSLPRKSNLGSLVGGQPIGFEEGDEFLFSCASAGSLGPGANSYGTVLAAQSSGTSDLKLGSISKGRQDSEDKWIDDIERKIKFQEIEHLYQKAQVEYSKIHHLVKEKNKGIRKKEEILLEKSKEFRLDGHQVSPLKVLLDKFDRAESKGIKEIRKPRHNEFYSALKEAAWNSAKLSATSFEKSTQIQDMLKSQFSGQLSCFSWSSDGQSLLVIGTTAGEVLELDMLQKKIRKYKLEAKVLSVDLSPDKHKFAVGLENGDIHIRKTYGSWASKSQKIDDRPIIQVRFASNETLICSTDFNLYHIAVKDLKLMFDLTKRCIVQTSKHILTQLEVMRSRSGAKLIVTTMNSIRMFGIREDDAELEFEIEKPAYIQKGAVPYVSFFTPDDLQQSYIVLFWHNFVLLIHEDGQNSSICAMKQLRTPIIWGTVLRNRVICILFTDFELNLESIQSIFVNLLSGGGFEAKFKLTKTEYSRHRNLSVTNEGNTAPSWSEVIRAYGNNVFFLRTDGIFKMYLMTLKEMACAYSDKGEWLPAFKLCTEVTSGKIRANKDEKAQMKQEVQTLATSYVDRFLDKSKKADELHAQITRVCIDAMITSDNVQFLFKDLRHKFDEIIFWREIDTFIEAGLLKKIPIHSIKDGGLYMQSDSLQHIVYHYTLAELSENDEQFHLLVNTLKRRKLWESLYRLAILAPENTLHLVLSTMMAELISVCNQQSVKDKISHFYYSEIESSKHQIELEEFFDDAKMKSYFRIFWFLQRIVSGNLATVIDQVMNIENIWTKCLEWMIDPSNIKVMTSAHIGITLETYFDLFMNAEFATSYQVAQHLCSKVKVIQIKLSEKIDESSVDGDLQGLLSQSADDNPEVTKDLICLALKATVDILMTFADPKYKPDISFLGLKLVSGGTFKSLLLDYNWIEHLIWTKISTPFVGERLLFHFEQLRKVDCEEKILRVLIMYQKSAKFKDKQEELKAKCLETKFYRVYCQLVEVTENSLKSLREYIKLVDDGNTDYLFNWIKRKLLYPINPEEKLAFCKEIMQHLTYLIKKSKNKAKEIIVMIPNVGVDCISKLE